MAPLYGYKNAAKMFFTLLEKKQKNKKNRMLRTGHENGTLYASLLAVSMPKVCQWLRRFSFGFQLTVTNIQERQKPIFNHCSASTKQTEQLSGSGNG